MMHRLLPVLFFVFSVHIIHAQKVRARALGIEPGIFKTGKLNTITDVPGVKVGHKTLVEGETIRTGVTAILPHDGNIFQNKVPAAVYVGNGFGKLTGTTQIAELGNIETPIILTSTLSVPVGAQAVIKYTLGLPENSTVASVNPIIGETNDGFLNDSRSFPIKEEHVLEAINKAKTDNIEEGNVGAGTGTVCFGYKGGIGTSSRVLPKSLGGYTVGVIVQTNFGGVLTIDGVNIAKELGKYPFYREIQKDADGSCMIVVLTDAPLSDRNLERLAKRAFMGLAKTGGIASNGSGDYVVAASTAPELRVKHNPDTRLQSGEVLHNEAVTPLFVAAIEATEEAIINSLFMAETTTAKGGKKIEALPVEKIKEILKKNGRLK
jgi:D-aminopeptidase